MSTWKAEGWNPCFVLFPRFAINGELVWGKCERRRLTNRYNDGFDHLRDIRKIWQFRRAPNQKAKT